LKCPAGPAGLKPSKFRAVGLIAYRRFALKFEWLGPSALADSANCDPKFMNRPSPGRGVERAESSYTRRRDTTKPPHHARRGRDTETRAQAGRRREAVHPGAKKSATGRTAVGEMKRKKTAANTEPHEIARTNTHEFELHAQEWGQKERGHEQVEGWGKAQGEGKCKGEDWRLLLRLVPKNIQRRSAHIKSVL